MSRAPYTVSADRHLRWCPLLKSQSLVPTLPCKFFFYMFILYKKLLSCLHKFSVFFTAYEQSFGWELVFLYPDCWIPFHFTKSSRSKSHCKLLFFEYVFFNDWKPLFHLFGLLWPRFGSDAPCFHVYHATCIDTVLFYYIEIVYNIFLCVGGCSIYAVCPVCKHNLNGHKIY
jgi:hypothetical protein